jgi:hypothetical protein
MDSLPEVFASELLTFSTASWRTMIPSQFSTFQTGNLHPTATPLRKLREAHRRRLIFDAPEPLKRW